MGNQRSALIRARWPSVLQDWGILRTRSPASSVQADFFFVPGDVSPQSYKKPLPRREGIAQWENACFAYKRSRVQSPVPLLKKTNKNLIISLQPKKKKNKPKNKNKCLP